MKKLYFIYKTIHKESGKYYIGAHETVNFNDGYMGSGKLIKLALKKYGKDLFTREILEICKTRKELYAKEAFYVTEETLRDEKTYNIELGGRVPPLKKIGTKCKNPNALIFKRMKENNPSTLAKGNNHWGRKKVVVEDKMGNRFHATVNDPRFATGEITHINKGKITVRDKDGNRFHVQRNDPRFKTGDIMHITKGLKLTCPHCKKMGGASMKRWHFNNCKEKESR